ncbi:sensor histidine kinase [Flagellimonas marinaquae]|jgi:signal transduction histidine kinase
MWRNILKTGAALYIPLLIFSLYWGYMQKQSLIKSMGSIQQRNILNKSYHLIDQSINLISITSFWSDINFPEAFSKTNTLDATFVNNYIRIMQGYPIYDQFRLIDLHGDEILRFERIARDSMAPMETQNKVDREYVKRGLALERGQVYVSPIELNKENGVIEVPHKPVLRGVTQIFDGNDVQVGLAVVNFNMDNIFSFMKTRISEDNFFLLDTDGKIITSNLDYNTLAHQNIMNGTDSMIQKRLELKNLIFKKDTFFMENGSLWTYQNVRTGYEKDVGMNRYAGMAEIVSDNDWAILQEIPPTYINSRLASIRKNLILFNVLTLFVIALIGFGYAMTQKEKQNFVARLKRKNKELTSSQEKLHESNRRVERSNQQLQVRNKQLEDFNYVVAHNLKAPVSSMSIIVDLLSKSKDQKTFEELFPKLETISSNIQTLTDDVQTYVSILNQRELELENVNLLLKLKDVEKDFVERLLDEEKQNFTIEYRLDEWHALKCNRFYMRSILHNLLSNALKFRRPDVKSHVIFETAWEDGKKVLYVKDNGLGIDLERHGDNLFKLYKRFHRDVSGKGMGLFIVKSQLEAMNASIAVDSEVGVGTTFKIKFNNS